MRKKIIFLDRDGTLIREPEDKQVDSIEKLKLTDYVIPALLTLKQAGYHFVMVSNQDGLGTESFKQNNFDTPHNALLELFKSQGIFFDDILLCPHFESDHCFCRKPHIGLLVSYLREERIDFNHSFVIGDRQTDLDFANNIGIPGILYTEKFGWQEIAHSIISRNRSAKISRNTQETQVCVELDLDKQSEGIIKTGLGFFDHMLAQFAKHGGFYLSITATGDLHIDEHHLVEDTAIVIGKAMRAALNDKLGIARYGFLLPMDESLAYIALDLSGRGFFEFSGVFPRENIGGFPTELVPHFFRSFCENLRASLHIQITGKNTHHMIESLFKCLGKVVKQAIQREGFELPSTKGAL